MDFVAKMVIGKEREPSGKKWKWLGLYSIEVNMWKKKSICELCREYKSVFICASHSVCLMNLKGRILRISKWKYFLNDAKLGYELKRRKDLCDE